jgi:hypothetical protein
MVWAINGGGMPFLLVAVGLSFDDCRELCYIRATQLTG